MTQECKSLLSDRQEGGGEGNLKCEQFIKHTKISLRPDNI
jgi:hypothetical protein